MPDRQPDISSAPSPVIGGPGDLKPVDTPGTSNGGSVEPQPIPSQPARPRPGKSTSPIPAIPGSQPIPSVDHGGTLRHCPAGPRAPVLLDSGDSRLCSPQSQKSPTAAPVELIRRAQSQPGFEIGAKRNADTPPAYALRRQLRTINIMLSHWRCVLWINGLTRFPSPDRPQPAPVFPNRPAATPFRPSARVPSDAPWTHPPLVIARHFRETVSNFPPEFHGEQPGRRGKIFLEEIFLGWILARSKWIARGLVAMGRKARRSGPW